MIFDMSRSFAALVFALLFALVGCGSVKHLRNAAMEACLAQASDGETSGERQARRRIIAISMLGMDMATHKEYVGHPFDLEKYSHLPMEFEHEVKEREVHYAAPIYEMAKVVDKLRKEHGLSPCDVQLVFGRGTFGHCTQNHLHDALLRHSERLGKSSF